ncbi:MAG: class I SAM-dependent methyltransferase family protein [Candidatus Aenigmarchaeota archaeon]|nr:class I SAM-dependent methyltransferase family protein [Candidatus Aenigmarchaeota archaeon]
MTLKQKISTAAGIPVEKLPSRYQIIGNVLLAKLFYLDKNEKKKFALAVKQLLPYIETVCEIKEISGKLRKPKIVKIIGKKTETVHKENDILYKLDVSKIMFSKGNLLERKRLLENINSEEVIVDMFSGIGYFSLSISKKCKKVYSIEKNPLSFRYLKENIILNKIENIKPIIGDSRKLRIKEKATRVLMGYFPGTEKFLPAAMKFLDKKGIIHYHNLYKRGDLTTPISDIDKAAKKAGFKIISFKQRTVKSYNPTLDHIVLDVGLEKL